MPKRKERDLAEEAREFYEWQDSQPDHVIVGGCSANFMRRAKELGGGLCYTFIPNDPLPKDPEGAD